MGCFLDRGGVGDFDGEEVDVGAGDAVLGEAGLCCGDVADCADDDVVGV